MTTHSLSEYQGRFIDFLVRSDALTFGDFTTKSGRKTPYFVNTGRLNTGEQIGVIGEFYAEHIVQTLGPKIKIVFGPAYKGIPLSVATSIALWKLHKIQCSFCFDRKESKDHGDKGAFVGETPKDGDSVVIIEDVITAGTTFRQIVPLLRGIAKINLLGAILSVDRCEVGTGDRSATQEISEDLSLKVYPLVTVHQIIGYLSRENSSGMTLSVSQIESFSKYLEKYGARS